jgi:phosphoribosylglycinamide formyltransferase-1
VTEEVDAGAVICQAAVPVLAGDDTASLSARIHVQEHTMYPWAVALLGQQLRNAQG